ncbi:MAG: DUF131 domain-containing protein [Crenarchaeota archaeon]|nr:DUF131 domain-containing protein [Thermoproteota archaeon]
MLLVAIGFVLSLVGMLLIMISVLRGAASSGNVEVGGGVLIGPIPVVFGSSSRAILVASILLAVIMAIAIIVMIAIPYIAR